METSTSLASGIGGRLLGTEQPPAILPRSSGQDFADEVARASTRYQGEGAERKRMSELATQRREARRAGFDQEHADEREARPRAANFHAEQGPVNAQPALASTKQPETRAFETPAQDEREPASAATVPVQSPSSSSTPAADVGAGATPTALPATPPPTAAPGAGNAPGVEPATAAGAKSAAAEPAELAQILRANPGKGLKSADTPRAPAGADTALLERANEILRQIELHTAPGVRRLTLELQPAELGHLAIQLALRAGKVTAIVRGERPETLALLAQRQDDLRGILARRGIQADSIRFELGFGGSRSGGERARSGAQDCAPRALPPGAAEPRAPHAPLDPPRRGTSLVDTLA